MPAAEPRWRYAKGADDWRNALPRRRPSAHAPVTLLIDGTALLYRAYFAAQKLREPLTQPDTGADTRAAFLFAKSLLPMLDTLSSDCAAFVLDSGCEYRRALHPRYKAGRKAPPWAEEEDALAAASDVGDAGDAGDTAGAAAAVASLDLGLPGVGTQRDAMLALVRACGIPVVLEPGIEADDVIATYSRAACEAGHLVRIATRDKDFMQLVDGGGSSRPGHGAALTPADDHAEGHAGGGSGSGGTHSGGVTAPGVSGVADRVRLYDYSSRRFIGEREVFDAFKGPPGMVTAVQAVAGDKVDNIAGVRGIGVLTAARLLREFESLEDMLCHSERIPSRTKRRLIDTHADAIRLAHQLVTLRDDLALQLPFSADAMARPSMAAPEVTAAVDALMARLGFASLMSARRHSRHRRPARRSVRSPRPQK